MLLNSYLLLAVAFFAAASDVEAKRTHYRCFRNGREVDCPTRTSTKTTPIRSYIRVNLAREGERCGVRFGERCARGLCCSTVGYCGRTNNHCGSGFCQSSWGQCGLTSTSTRRTSTRRTSSRTTTTTYRTRISSRTTTTSTRSSTRSSTTTTRSSTTTTRPPTTTSAPSAGNWWKPAAYPITWQINYPGTWNLNMNTVQSAVNSHGLSVINLDLFDISASQINQLHGMGVKVICYFSAGSYEDWRADAGSYPKAIIGPSYDGWDGENWLNLAGWDNGTPSGNSLKNIIVKRLDMAKTKGCDAVDPDNVDSYESNRSNTKQQQLNFNKFLANEAHARGIAIGLKNDSPQIKELLPYFDFAVTESCVSDNMCQLWQPFVDAGKPVFAIEYSRGCGNLKSLKQNGLLKDLELGTRATDCTTGKQIFS
ncbi:hypothetical protein HK097_007454 [Rhizophlyctis rosea]|uniref:alpha-galactosidase n=1 Tax=Rhizophlyctis rosea TaxID=64517 RepID=A0AAD5SD13_9FUNG|nr:hypothetical protein HK097_007454 [Rhizophlyctis rosea]